MTTLQYNTPVNQTNDADFRAWGALYSTALATVGLIQTADTGQIDWVTVLRPAINTAAGYEIYEFADALQASAPVFIKFEFGSGTSQLRAMVWITVGTGSDGAGNITGVYINRRTCNSSDNSPGGTPPAFFCHTDGFFGAAWGSFLSAGNPKLMHLMILQRTVDANGNLTAVGLDVITRNDNSADTHFQVAARFSPIAANDIGGAATYINAIAPGDLNASSYNRNDSGGLLPDTYYQVFTAWSILQPLTLPLFGCLFCYGGDLIFNTATTIGTTYQIKIGNFPLRTFMNVGDGHGTVTATTSSDQLTLMLWE
ncbi:hypothetical protein C4587_01855 [Candidatus Parcubacteria bacterium]|nr:MAG: hypothetical protein C4587_01855 [Candidatus Parcubacteria bacterium]